MTITNRSFRKAMSEAGLGKIELCKDNGYFWIYSEDNETANMILDRVEDNMILCNSFKDMTIDGWVSTIKDMIGFDCADMTADLFRANSELRDKNITIEENGSGFYKFHPGFILNIGASGPVSADRALDRVEDINRAVELLNTLNNRYKHKKVFYENWR